MAKTGFVSGAGAHGFTLGGPGGTHFSVTVVLVEEEGKREVGEGFLRARRRHFPDGGIRSAEGPLFQARRSAFMEELAELGFSFHALLVDKRKLHQKSPLQYRGTFYKFLSGLIYNNLYRTVPHLSVVASALGTPEFMESFRSYIRENHRVDLFSPAPFTFSDAGEEPLLRARDFLQRHEGSEDPVIRSRAAFVEYLLLVFTYNYRTRYVHTHELLQHVQPEYVNLRKLLDRHS